MVMRNQHYKVIFMDCNMPVKDGYTASKEILASYRKNKAKTVPLICAVTGHTDEMFLKKA